jgi:hypothetical protein
MHKCELAGEIYRNLGPLAVVVLKIISDWRGIACYLLNEEFIHSSFIDNFNITTYTTEILTEPA